MIKIRINNNNNNTIVCNNNNRKTEQNATIAALVDTDILLNVSYSRSCISRVSSDYGLFFVFVVVIVIVVGFYRRFCCSRAYNLVAFIHRLFVLAHSTNECNTNTHILTHTISKVN